VWNGPEKTLGCSPDGLIAGTKEAIEIKAPAPRTHIEMIRTARTEEEQRTMKKLLLATAFVLAGCVMAHAESLYGTTDQDFFDAQDRYMEPRSVEEYRRIVPVDGDPVGFCRQAEHLRECLTAMRAMVDRQCGCKPLSPEDRAAFEVTKELERGPAPAALPQNRLKGGWVKSADVECNIRNECELVDNYTDAGKRGAQCATFAIPVFDRPNGKIVGSLLIDNLVKRNSQRGGFTHVKSRGISDDILDFSECG
jgi:hypothetical protein